MSVYVLAACQGKTHLILLYTAIPSDSHKNLVVLQTVLVCSYALFHILGISKQKEHITGLSDLCSRQEACLCRVKWLAQRGLSPMLYRDPLMCCWQSTHGRLLVPKLSRPGAVDHTSGKTRSVWIVIKKMQVFGHAAANKTKLNNRDW